MFLIKFKNRFLYGVILSSVLTGCGGGGGGSSDDSPNTSTNQPKNILCSTTTSVNGKIITVSDHDTDKDGCLSQAEIDAAIAKIEAAEQQAKEEAERKAAEIARRTVQANITTAVNWNVRFSSASLTGNDDAIEGRAQLHTNISNGKFRVQFDIFPYLEKDEYIALGFSNGTAAQVLGEIEGIKMSNQYIQITNTGPSDVVIDCAYLNEFRFSCILGGIAIETITAADVFNTLPAVGNIVLFVCKREQGCYSNHATLPMTLN